MAPHSSTLAWKIPWMEEPGRLQTMGSRRVGHNWATSLSLFPLCIGEGNGNPLQCSCLENPRDGGAWWAAVYGVTQSRTWLKRLSSSVLALKICFLILPIHKLLHKKLWKLCKSSAIISSCLENPRDGGAWWAAVYGVAQSWTRLKRLSSSSSSHQKDKFESVLVRWMNLEPVIQSEASQKEKNKHCILIYICVYIYIYIESRKIWMNLFSGQEYRSRHREQTLDTAGEGEGTTNWESSIETYILP